MSEIKIDYQAVYSKTAALKGYISSDLLPRIESEYGQIQSMLDRVDGATNASLKESMQQSRLKSIAMTNGLESLLIFMANSSKEFEQNEKEMADTIVSSTDTQGGGE